MTHSISAESRALVRTAPPADAARDVAAAFEGLLLQAAFAPLAKSIGFYGDVVVGAATRSFARDAPALTAVLRETLAATGRPT